MQTQSNPMVLQKPPITSSDVRTNDFNFVTWSGTHQTETGLWLLIVGVLLASESFSNGVGTTLIIIGFILVTLGRNAFGHEHSRLALLSARIFFIGLVISIANYVLLPVSPNTLELGLSFHSFSFRPLSFPPDSVTFSHSSTS